MSNNKLTVIKQHAITYKVDDEENVLSIGDCIDNQDFVTINLFEHSNLKKTKVTVINLPKNILKTVQEVLYEYEQ